MQKEQDPKAQQRLQVILAVLGGRMTATQGAQELGVSRKTYYQWQERALSAMKTALEDRTGGRPANPADEEAERLREEVASLEKDRRVLEGRLRIQQAIREVLDRTDSEPECKKKEV